MNFVALRGKTDQRKSSNVDRKYGFPRTAPDQSKQFKRPKYEQHPDYKIGLVTATSMIVTPAACAVQGLASLQRLREIDSGSQADRKL